MVRFSPKWCAGQVLNVIDHIHLAANWKYTCYCMTKNNWIPERPCFSLSSLSLMVEFDSRPWRLSDGPAVLSQMLPLIRHEHLQLRDNVSRMEPSAFAAIFLPYLSSPFPFRIRRHFPTVLVAISANDAHDAHVA